jgi:hypothetical protein
VRDMTGELLDAEAIERIGLKFIRGTYYRGSITINQTTLATGDAFPVYNLEGSISVPSRNPLGRLISKDLPFIFKMQVHAVEGSILAYEVK